MLHSYSLATSEIDSAADAAQDIVAQLSEITLCENTVGIMACHYDYIFSGAVEAVCAALPFRVIGFTTFYHATQKVSGLYEMTVTVLTSDDVRFAVAQGGLSVPPQEVYKSAYAQHSLPPSLIMSFLPMQLPYTGDAYLRQVDEASGGIVHFGAVATGDNEQEAGQIFVIADGKASEDSVVMLLIIGDVHPRFYFGSAHDGQLLERTGTVTAVDGTWVQTINDQSTLQFLRRNGFSEGDDAQLGMITIPFLHRRSSDEPLIARTMVGFNEDGHAQFMGEIPVGSIFRIGTASTEDILSVARETTQTAMAAQPVPTVAFMFSCIGRYIALGLDITSEVDCAMAEMLPEVQCLVSYAAGEICPVPRKSEMVNRFHNNSFIVCTLY